MRETRVWSPGQEDPPEKEMATHCSTLAWKMLWMEEPACLWSVRWQRVVHDWATLRLSNTPKLVWKSLTYLVDFLTFFLNGLQPESGPGLKAVGLVNKRWHPLAPSGSSGILLKSCVYKLHALPQVCALLIPCKPVSLLSSPCSWLSPSQLLVKIATTCPCLSKPRPGQFGRRHQSLPRYADVRSPTLLPVLPDLLLDREAY